MGLSANLTAVLRTHRLELSPLRVADAVGMGGVLSNRDLYLFTGGDPPNLADLEAQYKAQVAGPTAGDEVWHNWIIRPNDSGEAVGFVQATVTGDSADVAWVVGVGWQGRGYASEAASAVYDWLGTQGIERLAAHIHPGHVASQRVAASLGMRATDEIDSDGEVVWASVPTSAGRTAD